ncbi:TatD family hydrolase [bacterium]|nr:TatD family hydrolase [bacterium]MBR2652443.1 TatD family hydrolase [bacterium]MBR2858418.1 TatD family hydrolase [bacterium]
MITFLESLYLENKEKILCVGECGLDFYYQNDEQTKKRQEEFFIAQIKFASKYKLPIMMHIRNAFSEAYEIIKKYNNLLEN